MGSPVSKPLPSRESSSGSDNQDSISSLDLDVDEGRDGHFSKSRSLSRESDSDVEVIGISDSSDEEMDGKVKRTSSFMKNIHVRPTTPARGRKPQISKTKGKDKGRKGELVSPMRGQDGKKDTGMKSSGGLITPPPSVKKKRDTSSSHIPTLVSARKKRTTPSYLISTPPSKKRRHSQPSSSLWKRTIRLMKEQENVDNEKKIRHAEELEAELIDLVSSDEEINLVSSDEETSEPVPKKLCLEKERNKAKHAPATPVRLPVAELAKGNVSARKSPAEKTADELRALREEYKRKLLGEDFCSRPSTFRRKSIAGTSSPAGEGVKAGLPTSVPSPSVDIPNPAIHPEPVTSRPVEAPATDRHPDEEFLVSSKQRLSRSRTSGQTDTHSETGSTGESSVSANEQSLNQTQQSKSEIPAAASPVNSGSHRLPYALSRAPVSVSRIQDLVLAVQESPVLRQSTLEMSSSHISPYSESLSRSSIPLGFKTMAELVGPSTLATGRTKLVTLAANTTPIPPKSQESTTQAEPSRKLKAPNLQLKKEWLATQNRGPPQVVDVYANSTSRKPKRKAKKPLREPIKYGGKPGVVATDVFADVGNTKHVEEQQSTPWREVKVKSTGLHVAAHSRIRS